MILDDDQERSTEVLGEAVSYRGALLQSAMIGRRSTFSWARVRCGGAGRAFFLTLCLPV